MIMVDSSFLIKISNSNSKNEVIYGNEHFMSESMLHRKYVETLIYLLPPLIRSI